MPLATSEMGIVLRGGHRAMPCTSQQETHTTTQQRRKTTTVRCRASQVDRHTGQSDWKQTAAAAGAALLMSLNSGAAFANEFDLMSEPRPTTNYVLDDAGVLNRITKKDLNAQLQRLEIDTGYRMELATVRKLEAENDAFAFGDRLVEKWYGTIEEGDKKGLLLLVTSGKDGSLTGGPAFMKALGDDLVDSIVSSNIPILTEQEKFNEAATSSLRRIAAKLGGKEDPGAPQRVDNTRNRTYKTKEETDRTRPATATIVAVLLGLAFVVPMLQFWGYTSKE